MNDTYIVAATGAWNRAIFDDTISTFPGRWLFAALPADLSLDRIAPLAPRYVFFLHWSWKVPEWLWSAYECVGFHMTDLPYGRGGTPLQNLILRGHATTKLTAFRLANEMDAGPVYAKADLSLDGGAEQIYERASRLATGLIREIVTRDIDPVPQHGEVVTFTRRTPVDSRLPERATVEQLYDFIRMLDADGYPHAFLECGALRIEFRRAAQDQSGVTAEARITITGKDQP